MLVLKTPNGHYVLCDKSVTETTEAYFVALYGLRSKGQTLLIPFDLLRVEGPTAISMFIDSKNLSFDRIAIAINTEPKETGNCSVIQTIKRELGRRFRKDVILISIDRLLRDTNMTLNQLNWFSQVLRSMATDNRFLLGQIEDRMLLKSDIEKRKIIEAKLKKQEERLDNFKSSGDNLTTNINNILRMKWIDKLEIIKSKHLGITTKALACTYVPNIARYIYVAEIEKNEIIYRMAKYQALGKYFIVLPYTYMIRDNYGVSAWYNAEMELSNVQQAVCKETYFHGTACHIGDGQACVGELSAAIAGAPKNGLDMLLMSLEAYLRSINLTDPAGQRFYCLPMGDKDGNIEVWPFIEHQAKKFDISLKGVERSYEGYSKLLEVFNKRGLRSSFGKPYDVSCHSLRPETEEANMKDFLDLVHRREPKVYDQIMKRVEEGAVL